MRKKKGVTANNAEQVVGIIIPCAWDSDGRPTAWAIAAYNEQIYQIDMRNEAGRRAVTFTGKKIKLSGNIEKNDGPMALITISEYEILEDPASSNPYI